jgi:thioredoxin reductase-like selenoprotein T
MASFLQQNFPELRGKVEGGNYPPPPLVELLSNVIWLFQVVGLIWMILGGDRLLHMCGLATTDAHNRLILPPWYYQIQENRVQLGIFLYLLLPQIANKWVITGAFEIFVDEQLVWSKLQSGRFPTHAEIIQTMVDAGLKQASISQPR